MTVTSRRMKYIQTVIMDTLVLPVKFPSKPMEDYLSQITQRLFPTSFTQVYARSIAVVAIMMGKAAITFEDFCFAFTFVRIF